MGFREGLVYEGVCPATVFHVLDTPSFIFLHIKMLLSSLPILAPPPQHIIATSHTVNQHTSSSAAHNVTTDTPLNHQSHRNRRDPKHAPSYRPPALSLMSLAQSEDLIEHRKNAIATFGYSWIKPAGCSKTMLGRREEEIEREEVERQLREAEEAEMRGDAGFDPGMMEGEAEGEDEGLDQRDLDEEVPDADADQTNLDDDEEEEGNETGFTADGGGGGEDTGFITGDQGDMIDMTGLEEEELMMGDDLDGDIPSAEISRLDYDDDDADGGEWQHTDTEDEIDDSSSAVDPEHRSRPRYSRPSTFTEDRSELMDMDLSQASIDQSFQVPPSSAMASHRVTSGNAFQSPSQFPPHTSTPALPAMAPPSSSGIASQSTNTDATSALARARRSWFSRTPSNPASSTPQNVQAVTTPDFSSSAAPAAQPSPQRTRRNLWARAAERGGNLFSSSSTATPAPAPATTMTPRGDIGGTTPAIPSSEISAPGITPSQYQGAGNYQTPTFPPPYASQHPHLGAQNQTLYAGLTTASSGRLFTPESVQTEASAASFGTGQGGGGMGDSMGPPPPPRDGRRSLRRGARS